MPDKLTRYMQIMKGRQGDYMAESPNGEWVKYADVEAVEEKLKFASEWNKKSYEQYEREMFITLDRLFAVEHAIAAKEAQLPEGMKHCTIVFKECENGHGWLTATNWVQHECVICQRDTLQEELAQIRDECSQKCLEWSRRLESSQAELARVLAVIDEGLSTDDVSLAVKTVEETYAEITRVREALEEGQRYWKQVAANSRSTFKGRVHNHCRVVYSQTSRHPVLAG